MKKSTSLVPSLASFEVLVRKVKETFLLGRRRVKQAIVRTYWQAGKYIHEHILYHQDRADYAEKVILKLAERVEMSERSLDRVLKLYRELPKIPTSMSELDLTHLYSLATIRDEKTRNEFAKRAAEKNWNTRELRSKIKAELRSDPKSPDGKKGVKAAGPDTELLKPKLGVLHTYRLIQSKPAQARPVREEIDQGFSVRRAAFKRKGKLRIGDVIESRKEKDGTYTAVKSSRGEEALYTYKAWVERVVDADTQFVEIDLGFDGTIEQYLRLRAIDAPEIDTPEGKRAKAFVEKCLRPAPYILLTSSRSDKFDRYLSDIFIPIPGPASLRPSAPEALVRTGGVDYLYLNNELLLRGLAVRMR